VRLWSKPESPSRTGLTVQGRVELVDRWRDLEPGLEDGLLPLEADVLGPLDEAAQIPLGLDVLADGKIPRAFLEERINDLLNLGLLDGQRGRGHLLSLLRLKSGERSGQTWALDLRCYRTQTRGGIHCNGT
jgi:hypothetical protein